ncbi:MAG: hypothetical protein WD960_05305 [Gemmatimonadota bacterium]
MLHALLTFFAMGFVALVVIGIVLSIVTVAFSIAFGLAGFILFKVAPIVLLGWIVLKVIDSRRSKRELSPADREWLESGR